MGGAATSAGRTRGLEPFLLTPIAVPRVWGGHRLLTEVHPELEPPVASDGARLPVGEVWEVSDVDDDPALHSRVRSGPNVGRTLRALLREDPAGILGPAGVATGPTGATELPLLFKFIDAREDLSVQVHPSDDLLRRLGRTGRGKSEAWVILDALPGARIYYGFEPGHDLDGAIASARAGRGELGLRAVPVSRGDVIDLPAGIVHAIGAGVLLAEIQQSSDITWRIHDWGRVGLDGKPRTLHLAEAARTRAPSPIPPCPLPKAPLGSEWHRAIDGPHFRLEIWRGGGEAPIRRRLDRFGILVLLEGEDACLAGASPLAVPPSGVVFVPAAVRDDLVLTARGSIWALWIEPGLPPRD
jgi:mannose-6-phosphate isomerase